MVQESVLKMDLVSLQIWILRSQLGRLLFFDHFRSLKNQKRLFMTHPTFDQRTSEYVGIRIDVKTLLNYTEKILNEENNEVFSIKFYFLIEKKTYCFIYFNLNSFILARFVDNILMWSTIENFVNICYLVVHFRF